MLIAKVGGGSENLLETAILSLDELNKYALHFSESDLIRFFNSLSETESKLREATQSRYVLEIGLVKLIEMRRVAPLEKILERLAKLETALANGNLPAGEIVRAETPLEKKTLKADFPLAEVPFPTKEAAGGSKFEVASQNSSEPPAITRGFPVALAESPAAPSVSTPVAKSKIETAPVIQIADFKLQTPEIPEFVSEKENSQPEDSYFLPENKPRFTSENKTEVAIFGIENKSEGSNLQPEINPNQQTTATGQTAADETENPQFQMPTNKLADLIRAMPVKMLPISSEELEHFDEDKLDAAYENKLLRAGDNLFPVAGAARIADELTGAQNQSNGFSAISENQNGSAAATAPARAKPVFEIPNFDEEEDSDELPVLPEDPTPEELLAYAQKHPSVKKVLRAFRGKIVDVKKL